MGAVQVALGCCAISVAAYGAAKHECSCKICTLQVSGVMRTCTASPRVVLPSSAAFAQQQMLTPLVASLSAQPAATQLFHWRPRQRIIRSISVSCSLHDAGSAGRHTHGRSLSSHSSIHCGAAVVAAATTGSEASAPAAGGIATAAATLQPGISEGKPPQSPGTSIRGRNDQCVGRPPHTSLSLNASGLGHRERGVSRLALHIFDNCTRGMPQVFARRAFIRYKPDA